MTDVKPNQDGTKKKTGQSKGFTAEERAAMKQRILEQKAAAKKVDGESAVIEAIAEMPESDLYDG